jgi:hypothetical protein
MLLFNTRIWVKRFSFSDAVRSGGRIAQGVEVGGTAERIGGRGADLLAHKGPTLAARTHVWSSTDSRSPIHGVRSEGNV